MTASSTDPLDALKTLAVTLQKEAAPDAAWPAFEHAITDVFGQRLFTVLAFDAASSRLGRLHSNRPDVNPVGGFKRVTQSPWAERVLHRGEMYIGSTRADIQSVFSEYETLWSIGCESVLNIPVKKGGATIGTMNLLAGEHQYDHADLALAAIFAQLAVAPVEASLEILRGRGEPDHMEHV